MKKYLLTALLWVFGLFGFTSATNYTFVSAGVWLQYTPSSITFSSDISVPENLSDFVVSYSCEAEAYCNLTFIGTPYVEYGFECYADESWNIDFSSCSLNNLENWIPAWTYELDRGSESAFNSITITDWQGGSWWWGSDWWMIEWWISALSPILSWLTFSSWRRRK